MKVLLRNINKANCPASAQVDDRAFVFLREATDDDMPLVMAWRSNPLVWEGYYSQKRPLEWQEHRTWWQSRNADWKKFIIMLIEDDFARPVGMVHIGQMDNWSPEIGYTIGEISLWGRGIGREAIKQSCEWLKDKGFKYAHTTILNENMRSIRLVESLGFKNVCKAREGESRFEKEL